MDALSSEANFHPMFVDDENQESSNVKNNTCDNCQSAECCCVEEIYSDRPVVVIDMNNQSPSTSDALATVNVSQVSRCMDVNCPPIPSTEASLFATSGTSSRMVDSKKNLITVCRLCSEKFTRIILYEKHWNTYHSDVDRINMFENPCRCILCGRYLPSSVSLKYHITFFHKSNATNNPPVKKKKSKAVQRYCPLCQFLASGYRELERHLDNVHGGLQVPAMKADVPPPVTTDNVARKRTSQITLNHNPALKPLFQRNISDLIPFNIQTAAFTKSNVVSDVQMYEMYKLHSDADSNSEPPISSSHDNGSKESCQNVDLSTTYQDNGIRRYSEPQLLVDYGTSSADVVELHQNDVAVGVFRNSKMCDSAVAETKNFLCPGAPYCNFETGSKPLLQQHMHECHDLTMCPVCEYSSTDSEVLDHLKLVHSWKQGDVVAQKNKSYDEHKQPVKQRDSSLECHTFLSVKSSLNPYDPTELTTSSRLQCSICRYVTYSKLSLKEHLRLIHDHKFCPHCDYSSKINDLVNHMKSAHSGDRPVAESTCPHEESNTVFSQNGFSPIFLQQHSNDDSSIMESTYPQQEPSKVFPQEESNNKLFGEQQCNKNDIIAIMESVHPQQESHPKSKNKPRPMWCRVCGVRYQQTRDYRKHFVSCHPAYSVDEMFEDGWKCTVCSLIFRSLAALQRHWTHKHKDQYDKNMFSEFVRLVNNPSAFPNGISVNCDEISGNCDLPLLSPKAELD